MWVDLSQRAPLGTSLTVIVSMSLSLSLFHLSCKRREIMQTLQRIVRIKE